MKNNQLSPAVVEHHRQHSWVNLPNIHPRLIAMLGHPKTRNGREFSGKDGQWHPGDISGVSCALPSAMGAGEKAASTLPQKILAPLRTQLNTAPGRHLPSHARESGYPESEKNDGRQRRNHDSLEWQDGNPPRYSEWPTSGYQTAPHRLLSESNRRAKRARRRHRLRDGFRLSPGQTLSGQSLL